MNRDITALRLVRAVTEEVKAIDNRLEFQRGSAFRITVSYTDMPKGGHNNDGFDAYFAEKDELESLQRAALFAYMRTVRRAEEILKRIARNDMRAFARMYYCDDRPTKTVCSALGWTERRLKYIRGIMTACNDMDAFNEKLKDTRAEPS